MHAINMLLLQWPYGELVLLNWLEFKSDIELYQFSSVKFIDIAPIYDKPSLSLETQSMTPEVRLIFLLVTNPFESQNITS